MKKLLLFTVLFFPAIILAQSISLSSIEDSVLGWMKVYHFRGTTETKKVDDKFYSAAQQSICDSFANWMQASYLPKGGLGDVKRALSEKLTAYNSYRASLPQQYGAYARIYTDLKYNSNHQVVPASNLGLYWGVFANAVPGWPVRDLTTADRYYFTMPSFSSSSDPDEVRRLHELTKIPALQPYTSFWIKNIEAGNGTDYVLLCKNNRSPFIQLSKGEYLQLLQEALPRFYETEKKKIQEQNPGNQKSIDYFQKYLDEKMERFTSTLKWNREKYRNRLGEPALTSAQPSLYDLEGQRDVFSNGTVTDPESVSGRVPVYKIDPEMAAACKTDRPQWILVSWWWSARNPVEKHLHESIINNFNFPYVYDFFFFPEKVKGKPYKPLRDPSTKEIEVGTKPSEAAVRNALDKRIHFFEDFSTTPPGKKPSGWKTTLAADGSNPVVTRREGLEGVWLVMNDHSIISERLKRPLPQNFTLTYDLVAEQNFTWGAKGFTVQLSAENGSNAGSYLMLKLRPGFDGRDGETTVEGKFGAGYLNETRWFAAPGFSNNKSNNRITVTITRKGETLQVLVDKNSIVSFDKALPAGLQFDKISFSVAGNSAGQDKFFISNIRVTKDP